MEKTVEVKEIGKVVKVYFSELAKNLHRIGTQKNCLCCGNPFVIGKTELEKAKLDYRGKPKKHLELWTPQEFIVDVDLMRTPINPDNYTVVDQCIIFGVECVNVKICKDCTEKNSEVHEVEHSMGRPDRRLAE